MNAPSAFTVVCWETASHAFLLHLSWQSLPLLPSPPCCCRLHQDYCWLGWDGVDVRIQELFELWVYTRHTAIALLSAEHCNSLPYVRNLDYHVHVRTSKGFQCYAGDSDGNLMPNFHLLQAGKAHMLQHCPEARFCC